ECLSHHWTQRRPYDQLLFCIGVPGGNSFSLEPLDLRLLGAGLGCGVTAQPNPGNRPDGRGAAMALSAEAKVPKGSILPDEFRPFSTISSPCARAPFGTPGSRCPA